MATTLMEADDAAEAILRGRLHTPVPALGSPNYHRVRDAIRDDIIRGGFGGDTHLKLAMLATRYGLSAAPIREALNQLEAEGLVELLPNRGARIRAIDRRFVGELFEIRLALEPLLAERAAEVATPADIERLRLIEADLERAISRREVDEVVRLNRAFHHGLYEVRPNRAALRLLAQHAAVTSSVRRHFGFPVTRFDSIVAEHRALLDTCAAADGPAVRRILHAHIQHSIAELLPRIPA